MLLRQRNSFRGSHKIKGFTLMEILIALSIAAISLVPLLHLLVASMSVMDSASYLSRASLIGNAKLVEVIGKGYPELGTESGIIDNEDCNVVFKWQVNVTDAHAKELVALNLNGLRKISVSVIWNQGQREKQVSMSTYVSPNPVVTNAIVQENVSSKQ